MIDLTTFKLEDIKKYSIAELEELAAEIRKQIIENVSLNGGHLSSNLGIVELTIALHYVFDSPHDKIIFDVSHQTYAHKILTGRSLTGLRTAKGVSGFAKMKESPHDVFEAGHSSTSIAAGLGFVKARTSGAPIGEVVAVVGDASFNNGISFEAINILGENPNEKMIIIINDNEMSISKNVGALARTFNAIQVGRSYRLAKRLVPRFIRKFVNRLSGSFKTYVYNDKFFLNLGFSYIEGIDGHNLKQLIKYLQYAKNNKQSVVCHIKTIKGKGYQPAEDDQIGLWHSVPPFNIETGQFSEPSKLTNGSVIGDYLIGKVKTFPNIKVITPAMTLGSGLENFSKYCQENFIDVGIAEETAVIMASSLSLAGFIPIVFIYSSFLQRVYDQILHDIARTNRHVIFCIDRAGLIAGDGDTHQGIYDLAFLKTIPKIKIYEPKSKTDLIKIMEYAILHPAPYAIRYGKQAIDCSKSLIDVNHWDILKPLKAVNIISHGALVSKIATTMEKLQLEFGLVDAHCLNPIDKDFLNSLNQNEKMVFHVIEEVIENGSLYDDLCKYSKEMPNISIIPHTLPNDFLITGTISEMMDKYHLNLEKILKTILEGEII